MHNRSNLKRKAGKTPLYLLLFGLALTIAPFPSFMPAAAVYAQGNSGITAPAPGEMISGVVEVRGTAVHPDYLRYELAFMQQDVSGADWIVFAEGTEQISDGVLAVWNTTVGREINAPVFPDGRYQLRLRVVKNDFNYDEYYVTDLVIQNDGPTPTPTVDEAGVVLTETAAAVPLPASGTIESSFQQPTPLASLTPFPTPTAPPTLPGGTPLAPQVAADDAGGLLGELEALETGQVGTAFWWGIRLTLGLFMAAGIYLLLRWGGRRLWYSYWLPKNREK